MKVPIDTRERGVCPDTATATSSTRTRIQNVAGQHDRMCDACPRCRVDWVWRVGHARGFPHLGGAANTGAYDPRTTQRHRGEWGGRGGCRSQQTRVTTRCHMPVRAGVTRKGARLGLTACATIASAQKVPPAVYPTQECCTHNGKLSKEGTCASKSRSGGCPSHAEDTAS